MKNILTFIFIILLSSISMAQTFCPLNGEVLEPKRVKSLENFKKIAVLENGRVKPLETFADNILLQLSGKKTYERKPAINWLADLFFAPESTRKDKIFLINSSQIPNALGIEVSKNRRYSFDQIEPKFEKLKSLAISAEKIDSNQRDIVENEIIRLYANFITYADLSLSFSFVVPNPNFVITDKENLTKLDLPSQDAPFSYLDIALKAEKLANITQKLDSIPKEQWSKAQQEILGVINNLYDWTNTYQNLPPSVMPSFHQGDELWYSPWDIMGHALQSEEGRAELLAWQNMASAYWYGEQLNFDINAKNLNSSIAKRTATNKNNSINHIPLELFFNFLQPFIWSTLFYGLTFFLFLISLANKNPKIYNISLGILLAAFLFNLWGVLLRMIILSRPPVSSLYETFIFVALIGGLAGLVIERFNKNWIGIIIGSFNGYVMLTIANKFSTEGDTLKMLVAVLDSNFWLSTHVISITIGYAGACMSGIVGHIYIFQSIFNPKDKKTLESTYKILIGSLGFALTMTFLGTNLGGIWADQSWGRFWGWDPKENGALLIVLWTALLFHAKIAKIIGPLGLAAGSAFGVIVVMWAWFGVNLLSIGLHSYGFTSGLAINLLIYLICHLLLIFITVPMAKKRLKHASPDLS